MVRELRDLNRLDARFAERLECDYNEALAGVLSHGNDLDELHRIAADALNNLEGV